MKITVQVKPNSRTETVELLPDGTWVVRVRVPPIEGRANERVQELLAEHFGCAKSAVQLVSGARGKRKIFEIG